MCQLVHSGMQIFTGAGSVYKCSPVGVTADSEPEKWLCRRDLLDEFSSLFNNNTVFSGVHPGWYLYNRAGYAVRCGLSVLLRLGLSTP